MVVANYVERWLHKDHSTIEICSCIHITTTYCGQADSGRLLVAFPDELGW